MTSYHGMGAAMNNNNTGALVVMFVIMVGVAIVVSEIAIRLCELIK